MRNRAKCKLCKSVIESFHEHDWVECQCGEISIDGGQYYLKASAKDFTNFLRIDDVGNEIVVSVRDKEEKDPNGTIQKWAQDTIVEAIERREQRPTREELLKELSSLIENIERLPTHALELPINHYDFACALMLLSSILRSS